MFHVDWKFYTYDETATSLRATGHTFADFRAYIADGRTHRIGDLAQFQAPSAATDERAVWRSLALEDPQHPPLYFWLTSFSERLTGDSVFFRRFPAVVFGLLALPAVWWLAFELFSDRRVAWCVAALVAVSPFHVVFAQNAREYSLWTFMTAVSSALVLRYLRVGAADAGGRSRSQASLRLWLAYAASVTVGLWSFSLFGLVVAAHALYLVATSSKAPLRRKAYAAFALVAGVAAFAPWIRVILERSNVALQDTATYAVGMTAPIYAAKWIFNIGTVFFDLDYTTLSLVPIAPLVLAIAAWSIYVLVRSAPERVSAFVFILGGVAAAAFLAPDLALHQSRSVQASRYLIPLWLAIELATGYGLVVALSTAGRIAAIAGRTATAGMLSVGIASCAVGAFAHTWWLYGAQPTLPAIEAALRAAPAPHVSYTSSDFTLLEIAATARDDMTFAFHRTLDADALRGGVELCDLLSERGTKSGDRVTRTRGSAAGAISHIARRYARPDARERGRHCRARRSLPLPVMQNAGVFGRRFRIFDRFPERR